MELVLNSMDIAPMDGTPILVYMEEDSMGSKWHIARLRHSIKLIGHQFAYDCPPMVGWISLPTGEPYTVEV